MSCNLQQCRRPSRGPLKGVLKIHVGPMAASEGGASLHTSRAKRHPRAESRKVRAFYGEHGTPGPGQGPFPPG